MLVATVNSWREPMSPPGRRLVSEKEWDLLQKEVGHLALITQTHILPPHISPPSVCGSMYVASYSSCNQPSHIPVIRLLARQSLLP